MNGLIMANAYYIFQREKALAIYHKTFSATVKSVGLEVHKFRECLIRLYFSTCKPM